MSRGRQLLLQTKKKKGKKKALVIASLKAQAAKTKEEFDILQAQLASLKVQTAKKKEELENLEAALCSKVDDSDGEVDEASQTYRNWCCTDVGGLKPKRWSVVGEVVPAVQSVWLRKACKGCGMPIKVWCGYNGYRWYKLSTDRTWTRGPKSMSAANQQWTLT